MTNLKELTIEITPNLRSKYSKVTFGSLEVKNVPNRKKNHVLEEKKQKLELEIQHNWSNSDKDEIIDSYNEFFNRWAKTYPIQYQLRTIHGGGKFPQVSVLVDSMFLAELKSRILTSGHDLDLIQGKLTFDVSEGNEQYLKINGKIQVLKKDDVIVKDEEGILASVLYGPARRTSIVYKTGNALYLAWCPFGLARELITDHLNHVLRNLSPIYPSISSKLTIHCL